MANRFTHNILVLLKGKHKVMEMVGTLRSKEVSSEVTRHAPHSLGRRGRERELQEDPNGNNIMDVGVEDEAASYPPSH